MLLCVQVRLHGGLWGIQRTPAPMQSRGVVLTLIGHGNLHIQEALP